MSNEEQKNAFLQWIGSHWNEQQDKLKKYCSSKHIDYDEDIFSSTVLKVAEKILKDGLTDCSAQGYDKYMFRSFVQNVKREKQYSRNARRDKNIENLNELWESYCNENMSTSKEKLLSDLKKDFSAIYILSKVESQYGSEMSRLFCEKFYLSRTYKQLQAMHPSMKKLRDTLLSMKRWAIEHISRDEIDAAFNAEYSDILD